MKTVDSRSGYWHRARETMSPAARERYQSEWLGRLIAHAWERAPGVRRRLDAAHLAPRHFRSTEDLARLPVIKKSQMPDLQKADPPFGGFCTVPIGKIRRIFVSPGPILEPMGPDVSAWHAETGFYAGGFRPGDVVLDTFLYQLVPAAHEMDEALHLIGRVRLEPGHVGRFHVLEARVDPLVADEERDEVVDHQRDAITATEPLIQ